MTLSHISRIVVQQKCGIPHRLLDFLFVDFDKKGRRVFSHKNITSTTNLKSSSSSVKKKGFSKAPPTAKKGKASSRPFYYCRRAPPLYIVNSSSTWLLYLF